MPLHLLAVGVVAGVLSGMLGIGGGLVMVPALVLVGLETSHAVGTSLLVVLTNAASGLVRHAIDRRVAWRLGVVLGVGAVPTAALGAFATAWLPEVVLRSLFAVLLVVVAVAMQRRAGRGGAHAAAEAGTAPVRHAIGKGLAAGSVGGLLSGLFGVGGGVALVPLQVLVLRRPVSSAVATSLLAIVIGSVVGIGSHLSLGHMHWTEGALLAVGGLGGAQVGAWLVGHMSDRLLALLFVACLVVLTGLMVWKVAVLL